ncbi:hypothetical protein BW723_07070 [Polaribacter reichenbachii]|uniref:TonB-dependent receptor plug domain-containing protein n=1 Tax=Polaribacter reichenbachii TaxID=996801 RepID=A0A1B8U6K9_9FLAO|nr:TonB-dependent receptor [Polaribacter reichenbachii]APZ46071.1 hypothetical protein BW723_07070 [Polaribacter reichenbachii]AUC19933.1 hypothetical protein BTO17_15090 [Polaribacter reichenbachii]OBY67523.1 hypothetical protein LPB301_02420 [Polaribacter reichenbachii]
MKNRKLLLIVLFNFYAFITFSQITIKGKVVSAEDNQPLPGATIMVKGTKLGTYTGFDGAFTLNITKEAKTIIVSYLGFITQEININGSDYINCSLAVDSSQLEEVVIIGYGSAKKNTVTGAVSSINSEAIENRPVTRVEQALSGQLAGVSVRATSGDLGAPIQVSVRGGTSISAGTEPLYVIDGFPADDIVDLAPSDIETISVLKDASQAAIYGSRGANGVVIITTKRGQLGKTKFKVDVYSGIQTLERRIDLLDAEEWIDINREVKNKAWVNLGVSRGLDYRETDSYDFRLSELGGSLNTNYMSDPRWETGIGLEYIDWQDALFRAAEIHEQKISATGGSDKVKFYVSGTLLNQEGIVKYTDLNRFNLRANFNIKLNDKLSLVLNLSPTVQKNNGGRVTGKDAQVHYALQMSPITESGVGINTGFYPNQTYQWAGSTTSPVAYMRELFQQEKLLTIRSNVSLKYKFNENFDTSIDGSYYGASKSFHRYIPTSITNRNTNDPEGSRSDARFDSRRDSKYVVQGIINYNQSFGKHDIGTTIGGALESRWLDRSYQSHNQIVNDVLVTFNETTSNVRNSFYQFSEDRLLSYFGRVNYSYDNKYLFSGSIRADGSSRFGKNNFWGTFPSFSLGWRIDKENFMSNLDAISMFKLRYGFGETGNNSIPWYRAFGNIATSNYSFNNNLAFGNAVGSIENTDLGWEKTISHNFGLNMGFLRNRFSVSFDYYDKKTSGMLLNVPVALTTGFSSGFANIGDMRNTGFEVELNTKNISNDNFKWSTNLNFSHNKNEIESLGPDNTPIPTGFQNRTQIHKVGSPAFSYYMYDAIGVYQNQADVDNSPSRTNTIPGDVKYRDVNNDGVINEDDITIVGNPNPDFYWGITNTFSYKIFDLSILLQGQQGGEVYGLLGRAIDNPSGAVLHNRPSHWQNRWRSETDTGDGVTPRIDGTTSGLYDSRWLYDATYWKVKNITLSATLPKTLFKGIDGLKIYFSADNLFMQDNYAIGFSPEALNTNGGDYGGYPLASTYTLGLNLQF